MKQLTFVIVFMLMISSCKQNKEQVTIEPEVIEQVESSSEWSILFDGTNFDNWRGYLTDEMYPEWSIEDGAMAFNPGEEGGKNIITKKTYTNFILSLEWKISEGGNSGIFWSIYEDSKFNEAYQTGPEIQVLDNARHPDALANPKFHQAGALYDMVQPMHDVCKPAGD